jgi:hypothetical protein
MPAQKQARSLESQDALEGKSYRLKQLRPISPGLLAGVRRTPPPLALQANAGHWFDALSEGKEAGHASGVFVSLQ